MAKRSLWILAGSLFFLFILVNYLILPLYVYHGGTLVVPDVVGIDEDSARRTLETLGLESVRADVRPDPKLPMGTVVHQNPAAEATVKYGRRVYLTVSGGEIQVVVPQLRGRSLRDAKFTLERNGLLLGGVSHAMSDDYPENTIVDQSIAPESKVSRSTLVGVTVSQGMERDEITIPDVIGKTLAEAERILQQQGLTIGNINYQTSVTLLPNTVVDQFPRGGESLAVGSTIELFVIKAGRPSDEIPSPQNDR